MPLSAEKCFVMHFGNRNPRRDYSLGDVSKPITTVFKNLGVIRFESKIYDTMPEYINTFLMILTSASRPLASGMIWRCSDHVIRAYSGRPSLPS